jgi:hypothetical protein
VNSDEFGYGVLLAEPEVAVLDLLYAAGLPPDIGEKPCVLFRVWVLRRAVSTDRWARVSRVSLMGDLARSVPRFKFDTISRRFSIYQDGQETPSTRDACMSLECAAVWEPEQVEERIRDHFVGVQNKWLQSLRNVFAA